MRVSQEYNLAKLHPNLAKQWHPTKNGNLKPDKVISGCHDKVWWVCDRGHEWQATIANRASGRDCPVCYQLRNRGG